MLCVVRYVMSLNTTLVATRGDELDVDWASATEGKFGNFVDHWHYSD